MFQLGREAKKTIYGKTYTFSRLERRIIEQWRDWIAEREGDPFAAVKALLSPDFDPAQAKAMIDEAKSIKAQLQAFSMACPLAKRYLETELGLSELFYLMLLDKQSDITRDEAFCVCLEVAGEAMKILQQAQGTPPAEKNAEAPAA